MLAFLIYQTLNFLIVHGEVSLLFVDDVKNDDDSRYEED